MRKCERMNIFQEELGGKSSEGCGKDSENEIEGSTLAVTMTVGDF